MKISSLPSHPAACPALGSALLEVLGECCRFQTLSGLPKLNFTVTRAEKENCALLDPGVVLFFLRERFASPSTLASGGQSHLQSCGRAAGIRYFFQRVFSNSVGPLQTALKGALEDWNLPSAAWGGHTYSSYALPVGGPQSGVHRFLE